MNLANTIRQMGQSLVEKKGEPPFDVSKADYAGAAKELTKYAMTKGGMDKNDFLAFANRMSAIASKKAPRVTAKFARDLMDLDTSPREKIVSVMRDNGIKVTVQGGGFKIEDYTIEDLEQLEELDEAMVRGKEVFDKTFANKTQADNFAKKNGGRVKQVGRVFYVFKESVDPEDEGEYNDNDSDSVQEAKSKEQQIADLEKMLDRISGNTSSVKMKKVALQRKIDKLKNEELDEAKRDPSKSGGSGYDLYHKDFSSAMKHAYDYAKSKLGIEVDPKEIDDKVASGPRKPSKGKTNTYRLKGKDGKKAVQIQVANLDDKKFELNMYKEEVELTESPMVTFTVPNVTSDMASKLERLAKKNDVEYSRKGRTVVLKGKRIDVTSIRTKMGLAQTNLKMVPVKEEVELDEAYKTPAEAKAYEDGKKAVAKKVSYDDNPNKKGTKEYTAWSKGHNDARAKMIAKRHTKEEVEMTEEVNLDELFESAFEEEKLSLEDTLKAIWEGKLDKVDPKAVKKDFDDRKDKDIDNDGDEDESDEYLHKKRQAISKSMKKDVSDKEDEPKEKVGKSGKQTKVDINPSLDEEDEKEMTSAEMEKRDEIMKSLEKKKDEFVKKYGDRAKEVMARTAIKMAKKHA